MAVMNVNPTRMELSKLKGKLLSSRKGHKILKDKRDELYRQYLSVKKVRDELRAKVQEGIARERKYMTLASTSMSKEELEVALMMPVQKLSLDIKTEKVMNIKVPKINAEFKSSDKGDIYSYGFAFTSADLDESIKSAYDVLPLMIKLAESEKSAELIFDELQKTRRRVNALENVLIPQYEETIKYITLKLQENERSTTARLMKVKDILLEKSRSNAV